MNDTTDSSWHFGDTKEDIELAEMELDLWRMISSFIRWQEDCQKYVDVNNSLTANEIAILHVIRMKDKAKSAYDVARLLNRDDMPNVTRSIRKLVSLSLIEKTAHSGSRESHYITTEEGKRNTDSFISIKKRILLEAFKQETDIDLPKITSSLAKMRTIYDEASRASVTHQI